MPFLKILLLLTVTVSSPCLAKSVYRHDIAKAFFTELSSTADVETEYNLFDGEDWGVERDSRTAEVDYEGHAARIYRVDTVRDDSRICEKLYVWVAWEKTHLQVNIARTTQTYRCFDLSP